MISTSPVIDDTNDCNEDELRDIDGDYEDVLFDDEEQFNTVKKKDKNCSTINIEPIDPPLEFQVCFGGVF